MCFGHPIVYVESGINFHVEYLRFDIYIYIYIMVPSSADLSESKQIDKFFLFVVVM